MHSVDASASIDAGVRLALVLLGKALRVVIPGRTVAAVGVDEVLATAAVVARTVATLVYVLLAIDTLVAGRVRERLQQN